MTSLAFAGSGPIVGVHALAARELHIPVAALASHDAATARERATQLGVDVCALADLPALADAVFVIEALAHRAATIEASLRAGQPTLVEPPLCDRLVDADAIVALAASSTIPLWYAENLAFAPAIEAALAIRRDFGPLTHLEVRARHDQNQRAADHAGGEGALVDPGVHPVAIALLLAAPAQLVGVEAGLHAPAGASVEHRAELALAFDDGLTATVEATWHDGTSIWDLQAASGSGVVRAELLPALVVEHDGEPVSLPTLRTPTTPQLDQFGYLAQLEGFVRTLSSGRAPTLDAAFARLVLEVIFAAYASAASGTQVALPYDGPRHLSLREVRTLDG